MKPVDHSNTNNPGTSRAGIAGRTFKNSTWAVRPRDSACFFDQHAGVFETLIFRRILTQQAG